MQLDAEIRETAKMNHLKVMARHSDIHHTIKNAMHDHALPCGQGNSDSSDSSGQKISLMHLHLLILLLTVKVK